MERAIVNHTDRNLSTVETSILAKSVNFATPPDVLPVEKDVTEKARTETAKILRRRRAKLPKCNIDMKEKKAIKDRNADKNILILPTDKDARPIGPRHLFKISKQNIPLRPIVSAIG